MVKKKTKAKLFRVYWSQPTSWGFDKEAIKLFKTTRGANKYAKEMVDEIKKDGDAVEENVGIVIENVHTGEILRQWVVYDTGIEEV